MSVRLSLLRGFELSCDGQRVHLPMSSQRLLAFLALHNRPLLRLYVAGNLWIDAGEERSNANLRAALWRLRRVGYPLVDASPSHLQLADGVEVDVHRVVAFARAALDAAVERRPYETDELSGDLLPDWYDEWVEAERERVRQLRLHALEALAEQLTAEGRYGQAIDACMAAVGIDALRESAHRVLIRVYIAEGNWSEALRQYRVYAQRLHDKLGLAPSPQMEELVRELVA